MKDWIAKIRKDKKELFAKSLLLLLTPVTAFLLMQFVYGGAVWGYTPQVLLANYLCIGTVYFTLCAVTNRIALSSLMVHTLCGLWGAANYFLSLFRGTPILPWDFAAVGTALDVASSYSFFPTWKMLLAVFLLLFAAVLFRSRLDMELFRFRRFFPRLLCLMLGLFCVLPISRPMVLESFGVTTDVWDHSSAYRTGGALATFFRNFEFLSVQPPEQYSIEAVEQIVQQVQELPKPEQAGVQRPNIVAIMNESWADFEAFDAVTLSESVTDYMKTLDNSIWGTGYASVFGAGTSASEFEFLTGNSMAFLPSGSIPYQQYVKLGTASLASVLKQNGYRTVAIHPGERTSWQRNQAYPKLGFDTFKCAEDMDVPLEYEHGYVSDASSFAQIIHEFEQKQPGEPLFVFNVTIQNHGSYTVPDYPAEVTVEDAPGKYPMAEQYLTLANKTDQAFAALVEYFSQLDEPTILLMFGDHQPSVEQEFLNLAYGIDEDSMSMEEYMRRYQVPYLFWANYPLPDTEPQVSSLNFLGQYLLEYAGIESSAYGNYLWELHHSLPAVTFMGYLDAAGEMHSHLETNEWEAVLQQYHLAAYGQLFEDWENPLYHAVVPIAETEQPDTSS